MTEIPHTIYLQWEDFDPQFPDNIIETTWCVDPVAEDPAYDVEYHRADDVEDTFNFVVQQLMAVREYIHLNAADAGHRDNAKGCTHPACSAIRSALARAYGFVTIHELDASNAIWSELGRNNVRDFLIDFTRWANDIDYINVSSDINLGDLQTRAHELLGFDNEND